MQYGTGPTTAVQVDLGLLILTHKCLGVVPLIDWFAPLQMDSERAGD